MELKPAHYPPMINWEQRRYQIAKAAMQGILANNSLLIYRQKIDGVTKIKQHTPQQVAAMAVDYAEQLIKELEDRWTD